MDSANGDYDPHSIHSSLRERIVEHLFVGEILRLLWQQEIYDVEVLRSEFDGYGYDIIMSRGSLVRHIQLKTSIVGGKRREVSASISLIEKPSACIVWIFVSAELQIDSYWFCGGLPGAPFPSVDALKVTRHTKANAEGTKLDRPNHRDIPKAHFDRLDTLDAVVGRLFGSLAPTSPARVENASPHLVPDPS